MDAKEEYYQITVWVKGRAKPFTGIRKYLAYQENDVYSQVNQSLLQYYDQEDILKIQIRQLDARTIEVAEFLKEQAQKKTKKR